MLTNDDVDALFHACQDAEIQRFTTVPSPYTREHAAGFVDLVTVGWTTNTAAHWGIRAENEFLGVISIDRIDGRGQGELGYWLAPAFRGHGYLLEASRAVLEWGFSTEGPELRRIQWHAVIGNVASARVAQRLGFTFEGIQRLGTIGGRGREDAWAAALLSTDPQTPTSWEGHTGGSYTE